MCRLVLLVVLWLLIGLLSISEALCPSLCLFGTILVTLCLMVWDWRVSRAEPMLSCWHDLLILFLSPAVLSFSSFHGLVVWGWGLWTDRVFSLSPGLAQRTPNNNNNNNIPVVIYTLVLTASCWPHQAISTSTSGFHCYNNTKQSLARLKTLNHLQDQTLPSDFGSEDHYLSWFLYWSTVNKMTPAISP